VCDENRIVPVEFERSPVNNLKVLHRTSVLILIVTRIDVFSYAYLQAGYALAVSKRIIILYQEETKDHKGNRKVETVSQLIKHLPLLV
jgi:hypothetical protein